MPTNKEKRAQFKKLTAVPRVTTGKRLVAKQRLAAVPAVIAKLKAWRAANKLSQRQAVAVMNARDFPVALTTLQKWEISNRNPEKFAARALQEFLEKYPIIPDADKPKYGRWKDKVSDAKLTEIRQLRESGMNLSTIAERFGLSESGVSRICAGKRSAKARGLSRVNKVPTAARR